MPELPAKTSRIADMMIAKILDYPSFMDEGLCVDNREVDMLNSDEADEAKVVCNGCPVKAECRAHPDVDRTFNGVWGGMDLFEYHQR